MFRHPIFAIHVERLLLAIVMPPMILVSIPIIARWIRIQRRHGGRQCDVRLPTGFHESIAARSGGRSIEYVVRFAASRGTDQLISSGDMQPTRRIPIYRC